MSATDFLPDGRPDLAALGAAAARCRGCERHAAATHSVFGAGSASGRLVLVGEQPGGRVDREGAPFVGPAGRVLDEALARAGVTRSQVHLTNAVKHDRFGASGRRRLHEKPAARHVAACAP